MLRELRVGITLQALGDHERAIHPLLRAAVRAPTDPNAWLQAVMALSVLGREDEAEHAVAALRELDPSWSQMWFDSEADEALRPFARVAAATYLAVVAGDRERATEELGQVAHDYAEIAAPHVRYTVALAEITLALFRAADGDTSQALAALATVITRLENSTDPGARFCVANALLSRGALLWQTGHRDEAMAAWNRVQLTYGDDDATQLIAAMTLARMAQAYEQLEKPSDRDRLLGELARRYAGSERPELRRRAAGALLATSPDAVADRFRDDPDPAIARLSAEARATRWLREREWLNAGLHGRALRRVLGAAIAVRHRPSRGIADPERSPTGARRVLAFVLVGIGRSTQVAAVVGAIAFSIQASTQGHTTDLRVLGCGALFIAGGLAAVLGSRLAGRFTVESLALAPTRLTRTAFATLLALGVAWLSPAIERVGTTFVFGPTRATYDWLGEIGLPTWLRIVAMLPIAPVEVFVMIALAQLAVVWPARLVLGRRSALVEALEDSFGTIDVGRDAGASRPRSG